MIFGKNPNNTRSSRKSRITMRSVVSVLFVLFIVGFASFWIATWCFVMPYVVPDSTRWQTGDIFFSSGNSWRSAVVNLFSSDNPEGLTHCGFVIIEKGRPMLVHMSTDKDCITKEPVDDYGPLNNVSSVVVRRLNILPDTVALKSHINRLLAEKKRFDNKFDHKDSCEYYCTEFVIRALQESGCHSYDSLINKEYIYPIDLANSPMVHKIEPSTID